LGSVLLRAAGIYSRHGSKNKLLLVCASTVAVFCLILTDLAPTVLDGSIQPLEPVLRSTFWLSTHVLIITLSYAAFFLAFAVGDVMLFFHLKDEKKYAKKSCGHAIHLSRHSSGIVLLAFGIILEEFGRIILGADFGAGTPKKLGADFLVRLCGRASRALGRLG